jgi:putative ABC transport system ATP-binding protein
VTETPASTPVVDVRRVVRTFDGDVAPVRALRDASLRVDAGEFVTVVGPSGCGKSTLLGLIAGLDVPDEGTVTVLGSLVSELSADDRARLRRSTIGMVFQFFNLIETMTTLENVALAARLGGAGRVAAEGRAFELLDLLGIADKAAVPAISLSGGQRQRLAIARALVNSPPLLLADEPTGALDSAGGAEILELMRRLNDVGQTIVMVTHDAAVAAAASRVVTMRDGRTGDDPARRSAAGTDAVTASTEIAEASR